MWYDLHLEVPRTLVAILGSDEVMRFRAEVMKFRAGPKSSKYSREDGLLSSSVWSLSLYTEGETVFAVVRWPGVTSKSHNYT